MVALDSSKIMLVGGRRFSEYLSGDGIIFDAKTNQFEACNEINFHFLCQDNQHCVAEDGSIYVMMRTSDELVVPGELSSEGKFVRFIEIWNQQALTSL